MEPKTTAAEFDTWNALDCIESEAVELKQIVALAGMVEMQYAGRIMAEGLTGEDYTDFVWACRALICVISTRIQKVRNVIDEQRALFATCRKAVKNEH